MCVGAALRTMYAKCGGIIEAMQAFKRLMNRNVVSWNVMVGAYTEHGYGAEAYKPFLQISREGFKRDAITYLSLLNHSCASTGHWSGSRRFFNCHIMESKLEFNLRVESALVHMYAKRVAVHIDDARQVLQRMEERNVITWDLHNMAWMWA